MTPIIIIGIIIFIVCGLIGYIFIRQTVTKKQQHQKRLRRALDKRTKDMFQLLESFPDNYLPKDIRALLYRCMVDAYKQLCELAPEESFYLQQVNTQTTAMEDTTRETAQASRVIINNPQQIAEVQSNLNLLNRFLVTLQKRGTISGSQRTHYHGLMKKLVAQLSIDNHSLAAKQALQNNNARLALQKYRLARGILVKDGVICQHKEQLTALDAKIGELDNTLQQEKPSPAKKEAEAEESTEWNETGGDDWKKKNVYD